MSDNEAIYVDEVRKWYSSGLFRKKQVNALRGVSFDVFSGEIFGLLGPNGAGKTTLIKIMLGIVKSTGGDIEVLGYDAGDRRSRQRIGYLPESHRIPRHLTGYSALEYYGQLSRMSRREIHAKRDELLEIVGLTEWGNTPVKKYSKGMQQRLGLAQAMLHDPDLLILDEPTDGVDPVGRAKIREILFMLKEQGKTIFLNSHLLQELELVCDRVAILQHGSLRHVGHLQELTRSTTSDIRIKVRGSLSAVTDTLKQVGELANAPPSGEVSETTSDAVAQEHDDGPVFNSDHGDARENQSDLPDPDSVEEDADVEDRKPVRIETTPDVQEVVLRTPSQQVVDEVVDKIRAASLSIESLARDCLTLEQAFLQLIQEADEEFSEGVVR